MNKETQDKIRREKLAFAEYATDKLNEAYPNQSVTINYTSVNAQNNRRWLTAYIDNRLAFGGGCSNYEAVENLIATFRPKTQDKEAECERTHMYGLTPTFSDHV